MDGILGRGSSEGGNVLERLVDGARGHATEAAESRDARVLMAWSCLDALEVREEHRGAIFGRLLDGFCSLKGETIHGLGEVPVWSMASDLGDIGSRCRDGNTTEEKADEPT